jgi:hypothetical protein
LIVIARREPGILPIDFLALEGLNCPSIECAQLLCSWGSVKRHGNHGVVQTFGTPLRRLTEMGSQPQVQSTLQG